MELYHQERPLITFALFAYNQEEYIHEAIEGAFSQTYEPLEIILSDDCSSDRTFDIMQEMAAKYDGPHEVKIRRNEVNQGLATHINLILQEAKGDYFSWAGGDDIAFFNKIEELDKPVLADRSVVGVHSPYVEIDIFGDVVKYEVDRRDKKFLSISKVVDECGSVVSQSHLFKTSVFHDFGPFMAGLKNEGPAITFREFFSGKVVYVDIPLIKYRIGSGVSTYRGKDANALRFVEPLKVTEWRLSAYKQMLADLQHVKNPDRYIQEVERKITFYENLKNINSKKRMVLSLIENICSHPRSFTSLRAFFRVLTPKFIYRMYKV